jgi:hypothetical protein
MNDQLELLLPPWATTERTGDAAVAVAHQHAVGTARGNPTPPDTRVAFTIVRDGAELRIAGVQYSFLGAPR